MISKTFFIYAIFIVVTTILMTFTSSQNATSKRPSADQYDEYNKRCENSSSNGDKFVNGYGDDCKCRNPFGFKNTTNTHCYRPTPSTTPTTKRTTSTTLATTTRDRSGEVYYEKHDKECGIFAEGRKNRTFLNEQLDECKCLEYVWLWGDNTECRRRPTSAPPATTETTPTTTKSTEAPTTDSMNATTPAVTTPAPPTTPGTPTTATLTTPAVTTEPPPTTPTAPTTPSGPTTQTIPTRVTQQTVPTILPTN